MLTVDPVPTAQDNAPTRPGTSDTEKHNLVLVLYPVDTSNIQLSRVCDPLMEVLEDRKASLIRRCIRSLEPLTKCRSHPYVHVHSHWYGMTQWTMQSAC